MTTRSFPCVVFRRRWKRDWRHGGWPAPKGTHGVGERRLCPIEPLESRALLAGLISIMSTIASKAEGDESTTPYTFTLVRSGDTSGPATVDFAVAGAGSNPANADDFGGTFPFGTVEFLARESRKTITVNVTGDRAVEGNEGFAVRLTNGVGAFLGAAVASGTIRNDDAILSIAARRGTASEGSRGTTAFTFVVTRSGFATGPATVAYSIVGSGGSPADAADFGVALPAGTVRFAAGQTSVVISVAVKGDTVVEPDEGFTVVLSNPVRATLATSAADGRIVNDDASLSVTAMDTDKSEGDSGGTTFTFLVSRSGFVTAAATVRFAVGGTGSNAANAADFGAGTTVVLPSGTVSFGAGETSKTIDITVHGDTTIEPDEDFVVTLSNPSAGATIATATAPGRIRDDDGMPMTSAGPQILLTGDTLTRLRQMAAAGTPQWLAFRDRLDANLDVVIADDMGSYQGEHLAYIADYALAYQVLKASDPLAGSQYADKAISLMKSGVRDYQKGSWVARQLLARGDGTTRTFTLPNTDVHPGTLAVYLSAVTTYPVVRGAANGQDDVDFYQDFLKVSRTRDGGADYKPGIDWRHGADYANNQIDWSPAGSEPSAGATYYVTAASGASATATTAFTVSGSRITFAQPPRANQAVFVQYVYGTHAADGSALDYQQTSAGDGGFNSIFIDDTYTSRYLGTYLAIGLDWLDGYAGFRSDLAQEVGTLLVRWADWLATPNPDAFEGFNGYFYTSPLSNYGAGSYAALATTALALGPRSAEGPRLLAAALDYRDQQVLPALQSPTDSAKGGYWSEGWNYGHNAVQHLLLGSRALESAGKISATAERQWAGEVVASLNSAQSAPGIVYDGGDVYQYPFRLLDKALLYSLSAMADSATAKANANYYLKNYPDSAFLSPGDTHDYRDLLFHDPDAAAAYWSDQPLQQLASGTGLLTARSDWGSSPTWVSLQMGNLLRADHQNYAPGQLQISRGDDKLLTNAFQVEHVYGDDSAGLRSLSQFGNIVAVDDRNALDAYGSRLQDTPYCMGVDYGTPGVVVTAFEGTDRHVYLNGDYHAAYSYASDPGAGGPASTLTRQLVYLRPDVIFVYDRVVTTRTEYDKQLRWNFDDAPIVSGNGFVVAAGDSKLFAQTFSDSPLSTTMARTPVGGDPTIGTYRVTTQNTNAAADVAFLTVFETADAAQPLMDATVHVVTEDGRMAGGRIGDQLVLFGRRGDVDSTTPLVYAVDGDSSVDHLLVNLRPGQQYRVVTDGVPALIATATAQGVLTFTTSPGTRVVEVAAIA